jgi:cell division protein FtsQ
MDDRGRLAQSVKGFGRRALRLVKAEVAPAPLDDEHAGMWPRSRFGPVLQLAQMVDRWSRRMAARLPRGAGVTGIAAVIAASLGYGVVKGNHGPSIIAVVKDACDRVGNAAGFRIVSIALVGNHQISREEALAIAGITGTTSLVFLNVEEVRERLKRNPWIADATVLKLYPGALEIGIRERAAFALWQKDRRVSVISDDGTVLEPYVAPGMLRLPLVVGSGAQLKAREFLSLLDRHPALRDLVRAAILVGERRWNLRLNNGVDVMLPEARVPEAIEHLIQLERQKHLISRDIVAIDLRLPDRVTLRLSDGSAQSRMDALKDKTKKKGGNA